MSLEVSYGDGPAVTLDDIERGQLFRFADNSDDLYMVLDGLGLGTAGDAKSIKADCWPVVRLETGEVELAQKAALVEKYKGTLTAHRED